MLVTLLRLSTRLYRLRKHTSADVFWLVLTLILYVCSVGFRAWYIYKFHNPNEYVYSDMKMYVDLAHRLNSPGYVLNIGDITHPPGNTWLLQYFMRADPVKMTGLVFFNFLVASLVPLSMGFLGWVTYGKRTAQAAIIAGSVYFPYIDFGGYYLAEIHLTLCATLCIALFLLAMRLMTAPVAASAPADPKASHPYRGGAAAATTAREMTALEHLADFARKHPYRVAGALVAAGIGGFLFSFAMALKMVALLAIAGFIATHVLLSKTPRILPRLIIAGVFLFSAAPLTKVLVDRCTKANEGHFCTGSNKSAADFLLGHKGRIQGIEWRDPNVPGVVGFGNPAAYQHGYRDKAIVPFLITNQEKNNAEAWKWIRQSPGEAIILSFEHVWDSFGGSYPWPPNATKIWPFSYAFHFLFLVFVLFPALVRLTDVLRERGLIGLLRSSEFTLLSPIFGVCAAVFLASGEVRYRIPWDPAFFVLAIEFYRRVKYRFFEPKTETGANGETADGSAGSAVVAPPNETPLQGNPFDTTQAAPSDVVAATDTTDTESGDEDAEDEDEDEEKAADSTGRDGDAPKKQSESDAPKKDGDAK